LSDPEARVVDDETVVVDGERSSKGAAGTLVEVAVLGADEHR
jgi:hypothetical protein